MPPRDDLKIFTCNGNPDLARKVCECLGEPLGDASVTRFPDGEINVKINEDVRGRDIFIVQPTCPPVNENLMELLIMVDAARRSSARRITAVMPYYGYARKDRKDEGRVPITAKLVANMLVEAGVDRVLALDLHATQIQGFFDIPVDHLFSAPVLSGYFRETGAAGPRGRDAGRGRHPHGARVRRVAGRRPRRRGQAAHLARGILGRIGHRRGEGEERPARGRHDHHRRIADQCRAGAAGVRRARDLRRGGPRRPVRPRGRKAQGVRIEGSRGDRLHPRRRTRSSRSAAGSRRSPSASSWPRPSAASTSTNRSVRCS